MLRRFTVLLTTAIINLLIAEMLVNKPAYSQLGQNTNSESAVNGDFNNVFQLPNQNNAENITEFNVPNIYPLDHPINTPVNTENDFGLNMSVGVNTLDANNLTVYMGLIFQPGRTNSHKVRMNRINKETELLEVQKQIAEARLQLLQTQISEAEIRLQGLQQP
ncbi:hypothetical protein [Nodularia sp. NIES-3585]|uniref:hypothetical protein n=1 Tax=Nodularia sp. NIES-3585 TaxID=1973477 RepID=UPI000B5CDAE4|nr:hypothetical protein [Nodularia sp. NIES-3585]GAX38719.1 hypothetical protein NIES3585_47710 [Nodularia sp. NIES-3585]